MSTDQQTETYTCIACDAPRDADNLFVLEMRDLAKIKGEEDGQENAFITPEDLPDFAVCAGCREPEEKFTLAESLASAERYRRRRSKRQADAEVAKFVSCFSCEESGKKKMIPRLEAMAPGWSGCNIVKGRRLRLVNPNNNPLPYVTSADLLKSGKEGFALCPECMKLAIPVLQNKARELGLSEGVISERIRPQSLVAMFNSVRRKEARTSQ